LKTDRLKAINAPQRVLVKLGWNQLPTAVGHQTIESIGEIWRIDDEWWRQPIARRYVEAILAGGKHVVLFEDAVTGEWWIQSP
jgi:hypothetical protein